MIRGVVHHQDELVVGITGEQQVFEKSDEGIGVLVARNEMAHLSGVPVERTKDKTLSGRTGSGNGFPLPPSHPAAP